MAQRGRPPKPIEQKRLIGNPGQRPLPDQQNVTLMPAVTEPPEPPRPLGEAGRQLWDRAWTSGAGWLARHTDAWTLLLVCEQMDERQDLRERVLATKDWRDRAGLRALDAQILAGLSLLAFNPVDRARLGVAEVVSVSKLDALRRQRQARQQG